MRATLTNWIGAAATAAALLIAGNASADGLMMEPSALSPSARASLEADIEAFKQSNPAAFDAVANVQGHRPAYYRKLRNPVPFVGRELTRIGPRGLLPMLEALAFEAPARGGATEDEWNALKIGMLEAVGRLRDPRASEVLNAAFANASPHFVQVSAAEAMGKLCDARGFGALTGALRGTDADLRGAAIDGLAWCRSRAAADVLIVELDRAKSGSEAKRISAALGTLGSKWGWFALGKSRQAEGLAIRGVVSEALMRAYARFDAATRIEIGKRLTVVALPSLRSVASRHDSALDPAARHELAAIVERVEKRSR